MKTCACYDEFGGEITTTRKTVSRSEAEPICEKPSPAEAQLFLDTQVVNNVGLIASTATTVTLDEHGFSAEQLSIKSKANNLPPCEAELQRTFGRRPKCDESGDYYPVQCSRNTVQSYYTKCWCVNIQTGEITLGSEHNVLSTTIVSSEDAVGEPNLDHGKHCRIGFGTLVQEREQILSNRISDDKTQFHWTQRQTNPWYKPIPTPAIYKPVPTAAIFKPVLTARPYVPTARSYAAVYNSGGHNVYGNTGSRYTRYPEATHPQNSWLSNWGKMFG